MKSFSTTSASLGFVVATVIARRGMKRKSLSPQGAATAWIVGFLSIACGARGFVLLMFYQVNTFFSMPSFKSFESQELNDKSHGCASIYFVSHFYVVFLYSALLLF